MVSRDLPDKDCKKICNAVHESPDGKLWCGSIVFGAGVCGMGVEKRDEELKKVKVEKKKSNQAGFSNLKKGLSSLREA